MDFFERQDQARRNTKKLVVLFILAVLGILLALNAVAVGASYLFFQDQESSTYVQMGPQEFDWFQPGLMAGVSIGTLLVIGASSSFKTLQIAGDGGKVARMLGGRRLDPQTQDADERKLLNIVEEMSIASGMPAPDVYVMDNEPGINAFAAGSSINEAAIGVTRGCMEKLNRDELQGVIAHEFSHILNGDMKLNLRLIGIIFGILVIGLIGYTIFRYAPYLMHGRRSRDDKGGTAAIGLAILVVGGLVWLVGSIGVFFGRLIQASVSRQREYLADASAVQFTRNPAGIRDALRKIGGGQFKAQVKNRHAGEISHMWFGEALSGLFATHPPLPQRIKAIDPTWDGSMLKAEFVAPKDRARLEAEQRRHRRGPTADADDLFDIFGLSAGLAGRQPQQAAQAAPPQPARRSGLVARDVSSQVGQLDEEHIRFAGRLMSALPQDLREAVHSPDEARGLVASLFLHNHHGVRLMQDEALAQKDPAAGEAADRWVKTVQALGPAVRLPLIDLCLPALRRIDPELQARYLSVLGDLIKADERIEPFEYALLTLLEVHLGGARGSRRVRYTSVDAVSEQTRTLLSALAAAGTRSGADAQKAFRLGAGRLQQGQLQFNPQFTLDELDEALRRLREASPAVKRRLIDAAAVTVAADGVVQIQEAELLRAFAAALECPLPPFIQRAE